MVKNSIIKHARNVFYYISVLCVEPSTFGWLPFGCGLVFFSFLYFEEIFSQFRKCAFKIIVQLNGKQPHTRAERISNMIYYIMDIV